MRESAIEAVARATRLPPEVVERVARAFDRRGVEPGPAVAEHAGGGLGLPPGKVPARQLGAGE